MIKIKMFKKDIIEILVMILTITIITMYFNNKYDNNNNKIFLSRLSMAVEPSSRGENSGQDF